MPPETYKAALFRGVGHVDVVDLPYPACGDDEAIVRNVLTGICGSRVLGRPPLLEGGEGEGGSVSNRGRE